MKLTLKQHHMRFKATVTTQVAGFFYVLSMVHDLPSLWFCGRNFWLKHECRIDHNHTKSI